MLKKLLSLTLAGLLLNLVAVAPVRADTQAERDARLAEKVKDGVKKLGVGEKSRIKVKLKDKTRVKGYVSAISEDGFSITDAGTGAATSLAFTQVAKVEGKNISTGAKVAIGVGIAVAALLVVAIVGLRSFKNDCCF